MMTDYILKRGATRHLTIFSQGCRVRRRHLSLDVGVDKYKTFEGVGRCTRVVAGLSPPSRRYGRQKPRGFALQVVGGCQVFGVFESSFRGGLSFLWSLFAPGAALRFLSRTGLVLRQEAWRNDEHGLNFLSNTPIFSHILFFFHWGAVSKAKSLQHCRLLQLQFDANQVAPCTSLRHLDRKFRRIP